jgi:hypothetical protein
MLAPLRQRLAAVAGIIYSSAGFVLLMGIMTAETKYPIFRHFPRGRSAAAPDHSGDMRRGPAQPDAASGQPAGGLTAWRTLSRKSCPGNDT